MMFGHNDDDHHNNSGPVADDQLSHDDNTTTALPPSDHDMSAAPAPSSPAVDDDSNGGYIMPDVPEPSATTTVPTPLESASDVTSDELMQIKQQAVEQLSPLVGRLDQKPEDQFQTIMMLIRAVDNERFIPQAFEAAKAISDEKERAQALLDIVNEINYFNHLKDEKSDRAAV